LDFVNSFLLLINNIIEKIKEIDEGFYERYISISLVPYKKTFNTVIIILYTKEEKTIHIFNKKTKKIFFFKIIENLIK
jgi:hypothetical protein